MQCAMEHRWIASNAKGKPRQYIREMYASVHTFCAVPSFCISVRWWLLFLYLFSPPPLIFSCCRMHSREQIFTATMSFSAISFVQMILVLILCAIFYTCSLLFCCPKVEHSKKKCLAALFFNKIHSMDYKSWDSQKKWGIVIASHHIHWIGATFVRIGVRHMCFKCCDSADSTGLKKDREENCEITDLDWPIKCFIFLISTFLTAFENEWGKLLQECNAIQRNQ